MHNKKIFVIKNIVAQYILLAVTHCLFRIYTFIRHKISDTSICTEKM